VKWVVYAKAPFAGPQQVVDYVGRYTHRVAISNHRIVDIEDGQVKFNWRDYRDNNQQKTMTRPRSSSGDSCSTFCLVDSTAFAITGSWAIDTAKRRKALPPTPGHASNQPKLFPTPAMRGLS